uniref:hypothetical protein n=1 Tax=Trinickia mobilis TaxID=2816356 RepID=UPI001A8DA4B8
NRVNGQLGYPLGPTRPPKLPRLEPGGANVDGNPPIPAPGDFDMDGFERDVNLQQPQETPVEPPGGQDHPSRDGTADGPHGNPEPNPIQPDASAGHDDFEHISNAAPGPGAPRMPDHIEETPDEIDQLLASGQPEQRLLNQQDKKTAAVKKYLPGFYTPVELEKEYGVPESSIKNEAKKIYKNPEKYPGMGKNESNDIPKARSRCYGIRHRKIAYDNFDRNNLSVADLAKKYNTDESIIKDVLLDQIKMRSEALLRDTLPNSANRAAQLDRPPPANEALNQEQQTRPVQPDASAGHDEIGQLLASGQPEQRPLNQQDKKTAAAKKHLSGFYTARELEKEYGVAKASIQKEVQKIRKNPEKYPGVEKKESNDILKARSSGYGFRHREIAYDDFHRNNLPVADLAKKFGTDESIIKDVLVDHIKMRSEARLDDTLPNSPNRAAQRDRPPPANEALIQERQTRPDAQIRAQANLPEAPQPRTFAQLSIETRERILLERKLRRTDRAIAERYKTSETVINEIATDAAENPGRYAYPPSLVPREDRVRIYHLAQGGEAGIATASRRYNLTERSVRRIVEHVRRHVPNGDASKLDASNFPMNLD